jgi:uncharacterized membrane-anchored protein YhcB (DUF1043 family)
MLLGLVIGLVVGALIGGFVVLNNQKKAIALLQAAKDKAEATLAKAQK